MTAFNMHPILRLHRPLRRWAAFALAGASLLGLGTWLYLSDAPSAYAANYNRPAAVSYADQYAHGRNPSYLSFPDNNCTNFISQVMRAGGLPDVGGGNQDPVAWWYNLTTNAYTTSWTAASIMNQHASQHQGTRFSFSSLGSQGAGDFLLMSLDGTGNPSHGRVIVGLGTSQEQVDPCCSPPIGTWDLLADQNTTDRLRIVWWDGIPSGTPQWPWNVVW